LVRRHGYLLIELALNLLNYFALEIWNDDQHVEASRVLQILNDEDIPDQPPLSVLGSK